MIAIGHDREPSGGCRQAIGLSLVLTAMALSSLAVSSHAAPPPAGKTYFTILLGLDGPYSWQADCVRFTASEICTSDDICGSWERSEPVASQTAFTFEMDFFEGDVRVQMDGHARVDSRGKKDTIAGAARARFDGKESNFGFIARSATRKKCRRLLAEWDSLNNPTVQVEQTASCVERANFVDPSESEYVLPYPVGKSYKLSQTYCYLHSSHDNEFAYDFDLPLGAEVLAARAGEVLEVHEDLPDDNPWPNSNYLVVQHEDGTVAYYLHLKQDSVIPSAGEGVQAGEVIALGAMSGTIEPHLHFVVYRSHPTVEGNDVSVNFSNAQGPVDERGGLIQGAYYKALSWVAGSLVR